MYPIDMAETAGCSSGPDNMGTCSEVSYYCRIVAGNTEIAGAKWCIVIEGGLIDRASGELARMTTSVGSDMALRANNKLGPVFG